MLCCAVVIDHAALICGLEWLCVNLWDVFADLSSVKTQCQKQTPTSMLVICASHLCQTASEVKSANVEMRKIKQQMIRFLTSLPLLKKKKKTNNFLVFNINNYSVAKDTDIRL